MNADDTEFFDWWPKFVCQITAPGKQQDNEGVGSRLREQFSKWNGLDRNRLPTPSIPRTAIKPKAVVALVRSAFSSLRRNRQRQRWLRLRNQTQFRRMAIFRSRIADEIPSRVEPQIGFDVAFELKMAARN
jgi:hypothetical protein